MKILYTCIGFMNPETNEFVFQKAEGEAKVFLQKLLEYTVDNNRTRVYQFRPEEEMADIVVSFAQAMLAPFEAGPDLDIDSQLKRIISRLLDAENKANVQLGRTNKKVKTGSIVLSLLRDDDDVPYFVFAKVDHTRYLEGAKLELQTGFSIEDRDIWKTAVVKIREDKHISIGDVLVYMDTQARYWTDWFLGLSAIRTDAVNTSSMYKAVSGTLKREVEKISVNDYLILWQTFVHRINAEKDFDYDIFINNLIDDYTPQSEKLDERRKEELKKKLLALPEKNDFDIQFSLDPRDIASMTKFQVIKISPGIELKLSSDVDVHQAISKATDGSGDMYIRIKCTDKKVYDKFH